ncbi:MAG: ABC transporter permease [Clostridiaceae bacterium]|nr:ABC transporter permease [Clostridiaceae bacterium]
MSNIGIQQKVGVRQNLLQDASKRNKLNGILPFAGLLLVILFFTIVTGGSILDAQNLNNLLHQSFTVVIVAVGAVFVYSHGGMDMSLGALQGITQLGAAWVITSSILPPGLAIPASILIGMLVGTITGGVHVLMGVPAFVASLCVRYICSGITYTVTSKQDIYIPYTEFTQYNSGVIKALVLIVVLAAGYIIFEYTRFGKNLKAIGGNITVAKQSGIATKLNIVLAYAIIGGLVGLTGFFTLTRVGMINASSGQGLELNILTAIVLGGFPLTGGSASRLHSAIIGALTVTVLTNGLTLWGIDPYIIGGIKGLLFILIVGVTYDRSKGKLVL